MQNLFITLNTLDSTRSTYKADCTKITIKHTMFRNVV